MNSSPGISDGRSRRQAYLMLAAAALGVFGSVVLYWRVRVAEKTHVRSAYSLQVNTLQVLARDALDGAAESIGGVRNLLAIEPSISSRVFHEIATELIQHHEGLLAVQWVPVVSRADRATRESVAQKTHAPGFQIVEPSATGEFRPALDRTEYLPIYYNESPADFAVQLGWDLNKSALKTTLDRAKATGGTVLSNHVNLGLPKAAAWAIVIVCPVLGPAPAQTLDPGHRPLLGYVLGICRIDEIVTRAWKGFDPLIAEALFVDQTPGLPDSERPFYFHQTIGTEPARTPPTVDEFRDEQTLELPLSIGATDWKVLYRPTLGWREQPTSRLPYAVLMAGILITFLSLASLRTSSRRSETVARQVAERTAEFSAIKNELEEDIRRREETERQLVESQQQLQALMENSPSAIYVKDVAGRYLAVNRRFAELYGHDREHFVGRTDQEVFPPEIANRTRQSDMRVISSGKPIELEDSFLAHDGNHTSLVHKFPLTDAVGQIHGLCGIATDISERKRAEAELRESRRQIESLLGQLPGMAFRYINDAVLTPVYVSRGALALTGHPARDFLEKHVSLEEIIHPEDRSRVRAAIGTAVKKHRGFEVEYRVVDRSGRIKWVLERGQGVYDEAAALLFVEGLTIDITQRKDAESEKLVIERRLLEGQKLESIGVLAGGIAHDFNNLLTGIIGNANLASLELPLTSKIHQNMKQIEVAAQRAAELCQQMLAYAGKGRYVVQRVELGPLIENTVALLRASISKRAVLRFEFKRQLPTVVADPTQLRQIVMNLVINASEALGDRNGDITISTALIQPDADFFAGAILAPPEFGIDFVQMQVRDTGCGMSAETMAKIFDPFFTTKFAGRGLGLAAVQGIIRGHRGGLKVSSIVGQGSIFTLLMPAAPSSDEAPSTRRTSAPFAKRDGHALLIDDEDQVLTVTAGMLNACGLKTEIARDGYEGLDLFRANPHLYDIVLLDMTMPRLSGEETLALLREVRPDVRVLFISGYNRREVVDSLAGTGMLSFIQKPFTLETLREQLEVMLG